MRPFISSFLSNYFNAFALPYLNLGLETFFDGRFSQRQSKLEKVTEKSVFISI
jgi:hypothetical protein